jgi:chromosome segregation ATPase
MDNQQYGKLKDTINRVQQQIDGWCQVKVERFESERNGFIEFLTEQGDVVSSLKKKEASLVSAERTALKRKEAEEADFFEKQEQLETLQTTLEKLPSQISDLRKKYTSDKENVEAQQKLIAKNDQARSTKKQEMEKAVELFNRNLGLYITKVEGTNNIKLTFDKIDAANPRAQFNCIFCLQADDTYAVVSCEPMISDVKVSVTQVTYTEHVYL